MVWVKRIFFPCRSLKYEPLLMRGAKAIHLLKETRQNTMLAMSGEKMKQSRGRNLAHKANLRAGESKG